MIYEELSQNMQCYLHKPVRYDLALDSVEFIKDILIPQERRIYICNLLSFEENSRGHYDLLITIGFPTQSLVDKCTCLISVPIGTDPLLIMNHINHVFTYYSAWDRALSEILRRGGAIKELMDVSAPIFGNPIGIHDASFKLVAETDSPDSRQEEDTSLRRRDPAYITSTVLQHPDFLASLHKKNAMMLTPPPGLSRKSVVKNLFFNGEFAYRIVITERNRPLTDQDLVLLEHMSTYITPLIQQMAWSDTAPTLPVLLAQMLSGDIPDPQEVSLQFSNRGWNINDYYLCMVFSYSNIDVFNDSSQATSYWLKQLIPRSEAILYQECVVVYVNVGSQLRPAYDFNRYYVEFMRDMNMKCAVSHVMRGLSNLPLQYLQASHALRIGQRVKPHFWHFYFDDIAPYFIMEQSSRELPARAVCASEIVNLYQYDADNGTSFFQTVKAYLDCGQNLAKASDALFIHRTTLVYRLKKIREQFRCDFEDPLKRGYYIFSCWFLSYAANQEAWPMDRT